MRNITCKLKDYKTVGAFLRNFLKKLPATYENGIKQNFKEGNRSISDLLIIVQNRFPDTSLEKVIKIIAGEHIKGRTQIVWCTKINKFVVKAGVPTGYFGKSFISGYTTQKFREKIGVDDIGYELIMNIKKKYYG